MQFFTQKHANGRLILILFATFSQAASRIIIKLNISPFLMKSDDVKTTKKLEVSELDTSSELVAGAGFEPTTFGL